ncbi:uncharacterized protein EI97DRAFT_440060 [Westerdykella ornata]|uniref:Rhodopsin domain-containing protein n=1 Tax=Westerdykella ornata TaxID=318751 RepID=A0A6A6JTS2_WESOR|nr:uncharacterized protein EI97DRAFT_440060 [Westerdykella ornata]KAF2279767.1 hypothetical protein EI97DRAFT_440060 [Westerdykella ornata]
MWIPSSTSITARSAPITPNNKSTAVMIATWILTGIFVVMFLARQAVRFARVRRLGLDDLLMFLATLFGIGLSATTLLLSSEGLGVFEPVTIARADTLMKGLYSSNFLYISSLCLTKLSLLAFIYASAAQRGLKKAVVGLVIFVAIWCTASLLAAAFQCKVPRPWATMTLNCYNIGVFWIVFCIIDMTTDVAIIMLSVNLVAYLNIEFSRKAAIVACFAPRILVISVALVRLVYLYPITPHDKPEFKLWVPAICSLVHVSLSISTACLPFMKRFFDAGESTRRRGKNDWKPRGLRGDKASKLFARPKRGQKLHSIDSSVPKQRSPDVSPRIPTPAPLSPLAPPVYSSPRATPLSSKASSKSPSLRLHIPPSQPRKTVTSDLISPQTASSAALSPQCLSPYSPQPLLSPHGISPIREPTPPPPLYSPRPTVSGSHYGRTAKSSPNLNLRNSPPSPRFSLFPSPATGRYVVVPQNRRPQAQKYPIRTSSLRQRPDSRRATVKFAVAPNPASASPSTTISSSRYSKPTPTQSIGTTPSIPSYYLHTPPTSNPPSFPVPQPPSPHRQRNQRILSPRNSSHKDQISPVSPSSSNTAPTPPRTPLTFWRDDTSPENAALNTAASEMQANRPWEIEQMPVVQDVRRASPKLTVRPPS